MGKSVKIADLAKRMIELAGYEPGEEIKIEYTGLRPGENCMRRYSRTPKYDPHDTRPDPYRQSARIRLRRSLRCDRTARTIRQDGKRPGHGLPDEKIVPEFKSKNSEFEQFDKVQPA